MITEEACICCRKAFAFNPRRVPSLTVDGEFAPICAKCVDYFNVLRRTNGVEPIVVRPGAYDIDVPVRPRETTAAGRA